MNGINLFSASLNEIIATAHQETLPKGSKTEPGNKPEKSVEPDDTDLFGWAMGLH
jgi:hypothetical protein